MGRHKDAEEDDAERVEEEQEQIPEGWRPSQATIRRIQEPSDSFQPALDYQPQGNVPDVEKHEDAGHQEEVTAEANATYTGMIEHYRFREQNQRLNEEVEESHETFTSEKPISDANGNVYDQGARPDYVDYRNHVIVDLKPIHQGETESQVYEKYADQIQRYKDAYRNARGVEPEVVLQFYNADDKEDYCG